MKRDTLWSLRLGFSGKQADSIAASGLESFLKKSFDAPFDRNLPAFLADDPKSLDEIKKYRALAKENSGPAKEILSRQVRNAIELRAWWLEKMYGSQFPLREKMTVFWHNHFVSTIPKVKVNRWMYEHNMILRENAFGNLKKLTKKILKSNAMVRYLDNTDNRKGKINENLSRELLELFTLGIGNYTEDDIRNGAKALAGLAPSDANAQYRPLLQDDDAITYLGKTGNFKLDELVDIIFEHPKAPYLITRKILKWFIYDTPDEKLVTYYGDSLRKNDYELQPLLIKIFTEEFNKDNAGQKIKDPLLYALQLCDVLNIERLPTYPIIVFLRQQGMDLLNQPNVKGWDGGRSWLTSQIFLQRHKVADALCNGKRFGRNPKEITSENKATPDTRSDKIRLDFPKNTDNLGIISHLSERLLFQSDERLREDFEKILKYDFDPKSPGSENAVIRLFNAMAKTPEFQLI